MRCASARLVQPMKTQNLTITQAVPIVGPSPRRNASTNATAHAHAARHLRVAISAWDRRKRSEAIPQPPIIAGTKIHADNALSLVKPCPASTNASTRPTTRPCGIIQAEQFQRNSRG